MNFSAEWDQRYRESTHQAIWPWSDLVSLVHRHCRPQPGSIVLELGCGAGANVPFFRALGVEYFGIDGSETAIERLRKRFPDLASHFAVADFTRDRPFAGPFDLVVDRAALTHNCATAIRSALQLTWDLLKPGSCFIGVDWFSTGFSEFRRGDPGEDAFTRTNFVDGPFAGTGRVHFSDLAHVRDLFGRFELLHVEEKSVCTRVPEDGARFAAWNLVARRPHE